MKAMAKSKTDDRRRPERVASRVREELAALLSRDLADPRLSLVVLARVTATDDLSLVRVGVKVLGDDPGQASAKAAARVLKEITPTLRAKLAPKLGMRRVPALEFRVLLEGDEATRLDALLAEVSREVRAPDAPAAAKKPAGDDDDER
jgi:ribosome-binding factor A